MCEAAPPLATATCRSSVFINLWSDQDLVFSPCVFENHHTVGLLSAWERATVVVVVVGGCAVSGHGDAATMLTDTALSEAGTGPQ